MGRQIYRAIRLFLTRLAREVRRWWCSRTSTGWMAPPPPCLNISCPSRGRSPCSSVLVSRPGPETAFGPLQALAARDYADRFTEITLDPLSPEATYPRPQPGAPRRASRPPTRHHPGESRGQPVLRGGGHPQLDRPGGPRARARPALAGDRRGGEHRHPRYLAGCHHGPDRPAGRGVEAGAPPGLGHREELLLSGARRHRRSRPGSRPSLADLEAREFVHEKTRVPELEYIFKHALVQEATYGSILLQRRKEIHARVARVEKLFPDRVEEFYSLLAYHYSKSEDWEKAQEYLFAANRGGGVAADSETLAHYKGAIEAHLRAHGGTWGEL